jgi:hypothetical protein
MMHVERERRVRQLPSNAELTWFAFGAVSIFVLYPVLTIVGAPWLGFGALYGPILYGPLGVGVVLILGYAAGRLIYSSQFRSRCAIAAALGFLASSGAVAAVAWILISFG